MLLFGSHVVSEHACVLSQSAVSDFVTPWTVACQTPLRGIFQAGILEWVAISYFRGPSWPRDRTRISYTSCIGGRFFITSTTWEAQQRCQLPTKNVYNPCEEQLPCLLPHPWWVLSDGIWAWVTCVASRHKRVCLSSVFSLWVQRTLRTKGWWSGEMTDPQSPKEENFPLMRNWLLREYGIDFYCGVSVSAAHVTLTYVSYSVLLKFFSLIKAEKLHVLIGI